MTLDDSIDLRTSWWSRNWIWVVILGCLGSFGLCCGGIALTTTAFVGILKSSEVYQKALTKAKDHPDVQKALGLPIKEGFIPFGVVDQEGNEGQANLVIQLHGANDTGILYVEAHKEDGQWIFSVMEVDVEATGQMINLLGKD